ncbi:hypothetical protein EH31_14945 [Erythrobacter longus]|uniref:Cold-shock protein n=1 Tax=Erythrobacter longus TaxID=1044 RepID=A0A074M7N9_ERYLO|nr:DUF1294 domain-containing protein [Erythrobacter longus]KEO88735.1 hypothetical protein EH31_14945 [Erythrobacter longus]
MNPLADILTPANIITALIVMNFSSFAAFGIDKALAEKRARRISEAALLNLAFFGGIGGAYAGREVFRHKTRKASFSNQLHMVAAVQLCALVFALIAFW